MIYLMMMFLGHWIPKVQRFTVKTDEDRLIDDFEEINIFADTNHREPSQSSRNMKG